nr:hypothetical protein [Tanacetum cinerariifolium]
MNMGQDRQMQMVGGNSGNQFRQYAGNLTGYNDVQSSSYSMASEQSSSGPTLQDMIPRTISSGLVQKPLSSTSYVPPLRNDWDFYYHSELAYYHSELA